MTGPLLSIVVPTKNRYPYLKKLVELFHTVYTSRDVELVISDNSDDNSDFESYIRQLKDQRIKYVYVKGSLSVCENADKAIMLSNGEYVNMIGDDDANQREIVKVAQYMKEFGIESLSCYRCNYRWPGLRSMFYNPEKKYSGSLKIKKTTQVIKYVDVQKELLKILKQGASATYGTLPCVYNGIVKRSLLDRVYEITGTFFPGPSPDMSNAIALSLIVKKHVYLDYPISWAGKSAQSAGGLGVMHKHSMQISDVPWLSKDTKDKWEKNIPLYWTGSSVWAESAIKALRHMGRQDLLDRYFSYENFYGRFLAFSFSNRKYVSKFVLRSNVPKVILSWIGTWLERLYIAPTNLLLPKFGKVGKTMMIYGISDVVECENYIHNKFPYTV